MTRDNAYFTQLYRTADRLLFLILSAMTLVSFALAPWYRTWTEAIVVAIPTWCLCAWLVFSRSGERVTRCAIAAGLMVLASLQIHQSHGMIEAHFAVFVLLACLLYYRHWVPLVTAAGVIALLHLGSDLLQRTGQPVWVFASAGGFGIVLVHAVFVVVQTALLVWMSIQLRGEIEALGGDAKSLAGASRELANGDLSVHIDSSGAMSDSLVVAMESMRAELLRKSEHATALTQELMTNVERARESAAENGRIRTALDQVSVGVMLADLEGQIIYTNDFSTKLFSRLGGEIRKQLPQFDASRILGSSFDAFHRSPSHQRNLLSGLTGNHIADIRMGEAVLRVIATPVLDAANQRVGTVVQWIDRTQEVAAEREVGEAVTAAVNGNMTVRLREEGKEGFLRQLAADINRLITNVSGMLREISAASAEVGTGADEISRGNADLSQRTEEQASSLEQTASSMEQMTTAVKNNADIAAEASQLARSARDQAEQGGTVVQAAVAAMSEINSSSKRIADIIGVIDDIAFQTNLLALNAAVEAARAGEQGRGFAVVASEVRNLASRSAAAAKEIKGLIQESVGKVDDGTRLVDESGRVLQSIVAGVKKVTDMVAEIADSSREQASGIEQVNKAVSAMDDVTQQNAALVEEAAAAAQSLTEQAGRLNRLMTRYRLEIGTAPTRHPASRAA
jgi:methyl-accepting chemotaxis protein